ncbi:MAG: hypothetical protein V3V19_11270 [Cocleimonas sp.]
MATELKQPASGTVVTTILGAIVDINNPNFIDKVKDFPKKDSSSALTQKQSSFGRTGAEYTSSFMLTNAGGTSPFAKWKLMVERWNPNSTEIVELSVDYGNSNIETVLGMLRNLTKTVRGGEGPIVWIVTLDFAVTSISLS